MREGPLYRMPYLRIVTVHLFDVHETSCSPFGLSWFDFSSYSFAQNVSKCVYLDCLHFFRLPWRISNSNTPSIGKSSQDNPCNLPQLVVPPFPKKTQFSGWNHQQDKLHQVRYNELRLLAVALLRRQVEHRFHHQFRQLSSSSSSSSSS